MKLIYNILIYSGAFHVVSSLIFAILIWFFSFQTLEAQYTQGGIGAVFSISTSNYVTGLGLSLIFAIAAFFKGLELRNRKSEIKLGWKIVNYGLALIAVSSILYFGVINFIILFNPGYF